MNPLRWRRFVNVFWTIASGTGVLVALVPLVSLLWLVVSRGAPGLSASFFVSLPTPVGEPGGGVGNAIVGTFFMVGLASLMALPVGVGAGVYLAEKGDGPAGRVIRFTAEVLSGVVRCDCGDGAVGEEDLLGEALPLDDEGARLPAHGDPLHEVRKRHRANVAADRHRKRPFDSSAGKHAPAAPTINNSAEPGRPRVGCVAGPGKAVLADLPLHEMSRQARC